MVDELKVLDGGRSDQPPSRSGLLQPGAKATLTWATESGVRKIVSTVRQPTTSEKLAMLTEMAEKMGLVVKIQHFPDLSKEPD